MPVIGTQQSPIRIATSEANRVHDPEKILKICYKSRDKACGIFDQPESGHGNLILSAPYPQIEFHGKKYSLRKVHIHLGSEHRIDSADPFDYEVHLLHLPVGSDDATDHKVVIGIVYKHDPTSTTNEGLKRLNAELSKMIASSKAIAPSNEAAALKKISIPLLALFPKLGSGEDVDIHNWFHYQGSLTSEPYSEDVAWFVMKSQSMINKKDLAEVEKSAEQHARPLYALDRRFILRSF